MACDMCGTDTFLLRAVIEGSELKVCKNCAKYGRVLGKVQIETRHKAKKIEKAQEPEIIEIVIDEYAKIIKEAREALGLKQEELAQKLAEKESVIHHMESDEFKPPIALARKLEKFLHIKLVENYEDDFNASASEKDGTVTIGDFIKIRKKH